jgi:hypothetical protein
VAVPHTKLSGKLTGAWRSGGDFGSPFAGVAAMPSAEKAASFTKYRRENLPNIDYSRLSYIGVHLPAET